MSLKYRDSVVLVGGGPLEAATFALVRDRADIFVAADGGADALLAMGVIPDAVIGDMDSLSAAGRAAIPADRLFEVTEQDSTDFDKALRAVETPLIYAVGFTGARLDHGLAALHVLARYGDRPVLLVGEQDVTVHLPARLALELPPGMRVSLFPLDAVTVGMAGLRWSFEALALHPMRKIGTSNEASGGMVSLTSDAPGVVLIVPTEALDAVETGLQSADLHSPQR
ncbi:thiamine diphosphokinase [Rhodobacteraceae bacterium N5(2021)]|uniref:Thiamine diphosphokinase n=1 Tax=Gymnodinialimonas phycosphaerae TaxID=2841589 RepID=A0A975TYU3_9RHOB|nr:thiamine diphosphokinase [Gymnodinialimonas phycosphaerae]MBY4892969.1 thiamine diphosphokinase [Gymnodinialimonas phycosphaerae]